MEFGSCFPVGLAHDSGARRCFLAAGGRESVLWSAKTARRAGEVVSFPAKGNAASNRTARSRAIEAFRSALKQAASRPHQPAETVIAACEVRAGVSCPELNPGLRTTVSTSPL